MTDTHTDDQDTILNDSLALINEANHTPAPPRPAPLTFHNVSLYRETMFGITRRDCSSLTVNGTQITYTEKGKRKQVPVVLPAGRWARVASLTRAVIPDGPLVTGPDGVEVMRYGRWDPRWVEDFEAAAVKVGLVVLWGMG